MTLKRKFGCLWALSLYLVTSKSLKLPSTTDQKYIQECVKAHNDLRGQVSPSAANMKYMIWDATLANFAKGWVETCQLKHNTCLQRPYECLKEYVFLGENIWFSVLENFTPTNAITAWYNETEFYDYDTLACSHACGHYTQVVWASTYKVGCAAKICPNLGSATSTIFLCNYAPPGNFRGQHPYKKGPPCSECEQSEKCVKNLCKMPKIVATKPTKPTTTTTTTTRDVAAALAAAAAAAAAAFAAAKTTKTVKTMKASTSTTTTTTTTTAPTTTAASIIAASIIATETTDTQTFPNDHFGFATPMASAAHKKAYNLLSLSFILQRIF